MVEEENILTPITSEQQSQDFENIQEFAGIPHETVAQVHSSGEQYSQQSDDGRDEDYYEESDIEDDSQDGDLDLNESLPIKVKPKSILEWSKSDVEQQNYQKTVKRKGDKKFNTSETNIDHNHHKVKILGESKVALMNELADRLPTKSLLLTSVSSSFPTIDEPEKTLKDLKSNENNIGSVIQDAPSIVSTQDSLASTEEIMSTILNKESPSDQLKQIILDSVESSIPESFQHKDTIDLAASLETDDPRELSKHLDNTHEDKNLKDTNELPGNQEGKFENDKNVSVNEEIHNSSSSHRKSSSKSDRSSRRSSSKSSRRNEKSKHPKSAEVVKELDKDVLQKSIIELPDEEALSIQNLKDTSDLISVVTNEEQPHSEGLKELVPLDEAESSVEPTAAREDGDGSSVTSNTSNQTESTLKDEITESDDVENKSDISKVEETPEEKIDPDKDNEIDFDKVSKNSAETEKNKEHSEVTIVPEVTDKVLKDESDGDPMSKVINIDINGQTIKKILKSRSAEEEDAVLNVISSRLTTKALQKGLPVSALKRKSATSRKLKSAHFSNDDIDVEGKRKTAKRRVTYQDPIVDIRSHELLLTGSDSAGLAVRDAPPFRRKVE